MTAQISWQKVRAILVKAGLPMARSHKGKIVTVCSREGLEVRKWDSQTIEVSFSHRYSTGSMATHEKLMAQRVNMLAQIQEAKDALMAEGFAVDRRETNRFFVTLQS